MNILILYLLQEILIHIAPSDIEVIMKEIYRCTKEYIWGYEFYSDKYKEIIYRGKKNLHWKDNYPKIYLDLFCDLKLVKDKKMKYINDNNINTMFLLRKKENNL